MHSCVTQDKWEIKIVRRDAAAASILHLPAAVSVSLSHLKGKLLCSFVVVKLISMWFDTPLQLSHVQRQPPLFCPLLSSHHIATLEEVMRPVLLFTVHAGVKLLLVSPSSLWCDQQEERVCGPSHENVLIVLPQQRWAHCFSCITSLFRKSATVLCALTWYWSKDQEVFSRAADSSANGCAQWSVLACECLSALIFLFFT